MSALIKKEFRLLLPGFLAGLLLVGGIWLLPEDGRPVFGPQMVEGSLLFCSVLLMTLGAFGREFSAGTFTMLMAQPASRARIWRTKTLLLATMVGVVWCVWYFSWLRHHPARDTSGDDLRNMWLSTLLFTFAIYSGGLWSVLLFRQVAVAIWFTALVPVAICVTIANFSENPGWQEVAERVQAIALIAYGIAGFLFAMRLFSRAQDAQWTGGRILMPELRGLAWFRTGTRRKWRPHTAVLMKELQLHQVQFIMAGVLLVLHIGAVAARKFGTYPVNSSLKAVLEAFWVLWLLIPLLIGCSAVAEERKMGTLEGQLCLPMNPRKQFALKLITVILLSLLFGTFAPLLIEGMRIFPDYDPGHAWYFLGLPSNGPSGFWSESMAEILRNLPLLALAMISTGIGIAAFYASTLARNTLQALAPAILGILLASYLLLAAYLPEQVDFIRIQLWRGPLIYLIGVPVMTVVLAALAYGNYKRALMGWSAWRKNLVALALSMAVVISSTSAVYHRLWELLTPIEPPHGVARLAPGQARLQAGGDMMVFLPDGRVWLKCYTALVDPNPWTSTVEEHLEFGGGKFLNGTNWKDVVICRFNVVGVQRDGSLWASEKDYMGPGSQQGKDTPADYAKLVQEGNEHDWKSALGFYNGSVLLLLKENGTLWWWGPHQWDESKKWPGLRAFTPEQLGAGSDWAEMFYSFGQRFFRKTNGEVWTALDYSTIPYHIGAKLVLNESLTLGRVPEMEKDNRKWKSEFYCFLGEKNSFRGGIGEDGALREIAREVPGDTNNPVKWMPLDRSIQIGTENNWLKAIVYECNLFSLKGDGTLWKWNLIAESRLDPSKFSATRLGESPDWVDISGGLGGFTALATDGNLWFWQFEPEWYSPSERMHPLLQQSRRPKYLGNIFDDAH